MGIAWGREGRGPPLLSFVFFLLPLLLLLLFFLRLLLLLPTLYSLAGESWLGHLLGSERILGG